MPLVLASPIMMRNRSIAVCRVPKMGLLQTYTKVLNIKDWARSETSPSWHPITKGWLGTINNRGSRPTGRNNFCEGHRTNWPGLTAHSTGTVAHAKRASKFCAHVETRLAVAIRPAIRIPESKSSRCALAVQR